MERLSLVRHLGHSVPAALLLAFTAFNGAAQEPVEMPASVADWRNDLTQLVTHIRLLHPDPFTKVGEKAFLRAVEELDKDLPSLTDEERLVRVMRLVASLGDGHTLVEPWGPRFARWYPVRIVQFIDGYGVVSAHESVSELAGARILRIAGRSTEEVAESARALASSDNPYAARERLWALHHPASMTGLGYASASGALEIEARLQDGTVVTRTLKPMRTNHPRYPSNQATFEWRFRPEVYGTPVAPDEEWVTAYRGLRASAFATADTARPLYLTDRRPYGFRVLPEKSTVYARMNYVTDTDFVPFVERILSDGDRIRPRHFIVDWRQNFGGDGSKLQYMAREFLKRADDPPWERLYVLTGPKTFSAAIMALDALIDAVPLTIVGEPSAAGLNHFGDPVWRTLERTGLRLNVSTRWWQFSHSADLRQFVPVDVPAPFSFEDFVSGKDPAVDPILAGEDMRSVPTIAVADGGAAAARALDRRREKYGDLDWWELPGEYELRNACDELLDMGRTADALATCELNAELHPDVWNVWYNLAGVQNAAGLLPEHLSSYRCVAELAPENWNVPRIRRLLAQPGNEGVPMPAGCPAGS